MRKMWVNINFKLKLLMFLVFVKYFLFYCKQILTLYYNAFRSIFWFLIVINYLKNIFIQPFLFINLQTKKSYILERYVLFSEKIKYLFKLCYILRLHRVYVKYTYETKQEICKNCRNFSKYSSILICIHIISVT